RADAFQTHVICPVAPDDDGASGGGGRVPAGDEPGRSVGEGSWPERRDRNRQRWERRRRRARRRRRVVGRDPIQKRRADPDPERNEFDRAKFMELSNADEEWAAWGADADGGHVAASLPVAAGNAGGSGDLCRGAILEVGSSEGDDSEGDDGGVGQSRSATPAAELCKADPEGGDRSSDDENVGCWHRRLLEERRVVAAVDQFATKVRELSVESRSRGPEARVWIWKGGDKRRSVSRASRRPEWLWEQQRSGGSGWQGGTCSAACFTCSAIQMRSSSVEEVRFKVACCGISRRAALFDHNC
ncbi:hypothetical protein THAOC_19776, partial [Thalassiosira oceanica]